MLIDTSIFIFRSFQAAKAKADKEFDSKLDRDRSKRFEFLLKQTELFSHFMSTGDVGTGGLSELGTSPGDPRGPWTIGYCKSRNFSVKMGKFENF